MKKTISIFALAILINSCSSNENKMKTEIKNYLKQTAKDPESYEFVELKVIDTIIVGKYAEINIETNNEGISENEKTMNINTATLKSAEENKAKYKDDSFDEFITDAKTDIEISKNAIEEYKKENGTLKKYKNSKEILGYIAIHKCRMKNGYGALDLAEYYIEFDKDFKLLEMDKDLNYSIFRLK
jgi:hypothetical protein